MKLLFLTGHASRAGGGVSVAVRDLARAMAALGGVEVRVASISDGDTRAEDEPEWRGIDVRTFPVVGPRQFGASPALLRAMRGERYDLVHVHGLWRFHGWAALFARTERGARAPIVLSPHGMLEPWILARSRGKKALVSALFQQRLLGRAKLFHALSDKERGDIEHLVPGVECVVVPNIVPPAVRADARPGWWRSGFDGRRIFLFLGRLHEKKGLNELCEAWEASCARDAAFRDGAALALCGPIDGLEGLPDRVAALDARFGNIMLGGAQYGADKHRSMAAASFFCLPSKSEGVPLSVLEAWAAGVPAIITPECNLPQGFISGAALKTGQDAPAIATSLRQAFALSPEAYAAMASAGKALVDHDFSSTMIAPRMLALYERALR